MKPIATLLLTATLAWVGIQTVPYRQVAGTTVTVKGTSTLHDWHMTSTDATIEAAFVQDDAKMTQLQSVAVTVPIASLHSGKSAMDKNAYEALQTKAHPNIRFVLQAPAQVSQAGSSFKLPLQGKLTVAGTSRDITVPTTCTRNANGSLACTGSIAMKMTDFGVKPPVLMMGTLKTGNDITVDFNVNLRQQ